MSHPRDAEVLDQALSWHLRLKDADERAWLDFAEWLEAHPAHNEAYEAVADEDGRLLPYLREAGIPCEQSEPAELAANDDASVPAAVRRGYWRWGALATSIAAVAVLAIQFAPTGSASYTLTTVPGETRAIALADGSEIKLNGASSIVLDHRNERHAELLRGEARFKIVHDGSDPFTLIAGESRIVDTGTVFNVVKSSERLQVAVAEGAVRFKGTGGNVDLKPGDALSSESAGGVRIVRKATATIGSWADGALVYDRTPLGVVAEDLSRSLGVTLSLPAGMESKSFSGVIQTGGDQKVLRTRLEQLLGVAIVADGKKWTVRK